MTKKLEELLNLPESQEIVQEEQAKSEAQDKQQEQKAKSKQNSFSKFIWCTAGNTSTKRHNA